ATFRYIIRVLEYFIRPGGEVVNASVCKTDMRGFNSRPGLKNEVLAWAGVERNFCAIGPSKSSWLRRRIIFISLCDKNYSGKQNSRPGLICRCSSFDSS